MKKEWIIAIDGPSAAGKSTLGKALAQKYGLTYIDTGAMYRAVAWLASRLNIDWSDEPSIVDLIATRPIEMTMDKDVIRVTIDGVEVTHEIRTPHIGAGASEISALPDVKRAMIRKQQEMGSAGGVVMDGRDIGTFVFPNADFKFYLDASPQTRGARRFNELKMKGSIVDLEDIITSIKKRDFNDSTRAVAPLQKAPDAQFIDTSSMTIDQVFDTIIQFIETTR